MISENALEEQYDEEDSWEAESFLEGMEEAEGDDIKKKKKSALADELNENMGGDLESEFEEQFGDNF